MFRGFLLLIFFILQVDNRNSSAAKRARTDGTEFLLITIFSFKKVFLLTFLRFATLCILIENTCDRAYPSSRMIAFSCLFRTTGFAFGYEVGIELCFCCVGSRREDDWTCPSCGNVNFSFRTTCNMRNCTQPRPADHISVSHNCSDLFYLL